MLDSSAKKSHTLISKIKTANHTFFMPKKILIVEDDYIVSLTIKRILESKGYQIAIALNGEEGLEKTKSCTPDLLILDLMLPKLSGEEVCKKIRQDEKLGHLPIIMLTAKSFDTDRIIGKVIGADYYMTKPFNINELLANTSKLLAQL